MLRVLEVWPNALPSWVSQQLAERGNDVQSVIAYMSTIKYPKASPVKPKARRRSINYESKADIDGRPPQTDGYRERTFSEMSNRFPNLPQRVLKKIIKENNGWFTPSYRAMQKVAEEKNPKTNQYIVRRLGAHRSYRELSFCLPDQAFDLELAILVDKENGKKSILDRLLDIKNAKEMAKKEAESVSLSLSSSSLSSSVATNHVDHSVAAATAVDDDGKEYSCPVCYDDYTKPFMTPCSKNHDMCGFCLKQQVVTIVGDHDRKKACDMKCFADPNCTGTYSEHYLQRAVPPNMLKKLEEMRQSVVSIFILLVLCNLFL
jgi:hypothetical protein